MFWEWKKKNSQLQIQIILQLFDESVGKKSKWFISLLRPDLFWEPVDQSWSWQWRGTHRWPTFIIIILIEIIRYHLPHLVPSSSSWNSSQWAGSSFLDRIVRGLYFWNIILATVSDNSGPIDQWAHHPYHRQDHNHHYQYHHLHLHLKIGNKYLQQPKIRSGRGGGEEDGWLSGKWGPGIFIQT